MLDIKYKNSSLKTKIEGIKLDSIYKKFCEEFNIENKNINLYFTDDSEIRKLNKQYRGLDKPTDVLSFPLKDEYDELLGQIVISYETARKQSQNLNKEIIHLFIHSLLHLIGYTHNTEKEYNKMKKIEEKYLGKYEKE